jgi:hypothetical protein
MRDVARDPAALELELLRVQRSRLADRLRLPWWYLAGSAVVWGAVFAGPFSSQYLPRTVPTWPIFLTVAVVAGLMQWGLNRTTGIKIGFRNLRYPPQGRPLRIAVFVVFIVLGETELLLIRHGLLAAAIVVAALGVAAELALQQALLRGIRQELRDSGGAA